MQMTFTVGRDTSQAEYQRLIAALVVLGDVKVPDAPAQGELLLPAVGSIPHEDSSTGDDARFAAESIPSAATPDPTTLGFGEGATTAAPPPPPTADAAPPGPDVDAHGVRHDPDIHAKNRSKNGDGGWRLARGVDKELVERKLAEQKRVAALPVQAAPPPPPAAPAPPAAPTAPPPPQAAPTTPAELLKWATGAGKTSAQCTEAAKAVGLVDANGNGAISLILSRPDAVAALYAALGGES